MHIRILAPIDIFIKILRKLKTEFGIEIFLMKLLVSKMHWMVKIPENSINAAFVIISPKYSIKLWAITLKYTYILFVF